MRFKRKRKNTLIVIIAVIVGLIAFVSWQNNSITINEIVFKNDKIPEAFNGYRILQVSDLHNKEFGNKQNSILEKIETINPDIIVITGDLIDSNNTDIDAAMELINGTIDIAPIYYVSGNHEAWSGSYNNLKSKLEEAGVIVLDNEKTEVIKDNHSIDIIGLSDPSFNEADSREYGDNIQTENLLNNLVEQNNYFKILLSHRPELFDIYSMSDVDLVFSGHAHGGQVRLPFIGGLIAPDQGFLPKLTEGIHTSNNTSMVISRGLGNSIIPIRIFNRPELIVVTLSP
ncbi:metallophosphoesterase [Alloiococcus sp. CFN-8]|uniref:metallophosphoesterase n=1 Tax=Alloiococcus sp. CFN-8 TaxID=3416081 RepID=UPI003CEB523F